MSKHLHFRPLFVLVVLITAIGLFAGGGTARAQEANITVKPSTPNGWTFALEAPTGSGEFTAGPGQPPLGIGSVQLVASSTGAYSIGTNAFAGLRLDQLTQLTYSTYRSTYDPDNHTTLNLRFDIDYDSTDGNAAPRGQLVYEPYQSGFQVLQNTWQSWDALAANSAWWSTSPVGEHCTVVQPCSWLEIRKRYPNAAISANNGRLALRAGNPWHRSVTASADALTIGVAGVVTTFDFEPESPCTETCYVDGSKGSDTFGGGSPSSAKRTIQAAVNQVAAGGRVIVASGTYSENVTVTKAVSLQGPNAEICANTAENLALSNAKRLAEATIAPGSGVALTLAPEADSITIAGFRIAGPAATGILASDAAAPGFDSIKIANNMFDGLTGSAISSTNADRTAWQITCNRVVTGAAVGQTAVALLDGETRKLLVRDNYFAGAEHALDASALAVDAAADATIAANAFTGFDADAIRLDRRALNVTVSENRIQDAGVAIHLLASGAGASDWLESVHIQDNDIVDVSNAAVRLERPDGTVGSGVAELCLCGNRIEQTAGRLRPGAALIDLRLARLADQRQGTITVSENTVRLVGGPSTDAIHALRAAGAVGTLAIQNNVLDGGAVGGDASANGPATSAIYLQAQDVRDGAIPADAIFKIEGNRIGSFENGLVVFDPVAGADGGLSTETQVNVSGNNIAGNTQFGARNGAGAALRAMNNWWGDAAGPGGAGPGAGDYISANVAYCTWLDASVPAGRPFGPVQNVNTGTYFCTINGAVNAAETLDGHSVRAAPGLYPEQVTIGKSVTVTGSGVGQSILLAPATLPSAASAASAIVSVGGAGVDAEITGFTITGPGPAGLCGSIRAGIFVHDAARATIHDNAIVDIRDEPMATCQQGVAIVVGSSSLRTSGTAEIFDNVMTGYQKGGVSVSNAGSSAVIRGNHFQGVGPTSLLVQNGIQVASGATAAIDANRIVGHSYTPFSRVSTGILLIDANADTSGNTLEENQVGIYLVDSSGSHDANAVSATADGTESPAYWGIIVDAPPPGRVPQPYEPVVLRASRLMLETVSDVRGVQTVAVTNNELDSDNSPGGVGLQADGGYGVLDIDLTATNNYVRSWDRGVYVAQCGGAGCSGAGFRAATFRHNSITGNGTGFDNGSAGGLGVTALENWWGTETGPAATDNPGGSGNALVGDAPYSPWLCTGTDSDPAAGFQPDSNALCGLAAQLRFDEHPMGGIEGIPFTPQPVVRAVDAAGNPAPSFVGPVTMRVAPAGAAGLTGQTTITATGGVAVFTDLAVADAGAGYALLASSPFLPALAGTPIDIVPQTAQVTIRVVVEGQAPPGLWLVTGEWGTAEIAAAGGEIAFEQVRANRLQTVAIEAKSGYTMRAACSDGSHGAETVELTLSYQSSTQCTFTVTAQPATVTIVKQVAGLAPATAWRFAGDLGMFELPAGGGTQNFAPPAGVTRIGEDAKPGYDSTVACSNGAGGEQSALLVLAPGEAVTCTFAATEQPAGLRLRKTVGLVADRCASADNIAVPAGTTVYYCYTATNSGDAPLAVHALSDSRAGVIFPAVALDLAPGASFSTFDLGRVISETVAATVVSQATWVATAPEGAQTQDSATAAVNVLHPAIDVALSLVDGEGRCGSNPVSKPDLDSKISLCLTVRNAGEVALNRHRIMLEGLDVGVTLDRIIEPGIVAQFDAADIAALGEITVSTTTTYTVSVKSTNAPGDPANRNAFYPAPELFFAADSATFTLEPNPVGGTRQENWVFLPAIVR